MLLSLCSLLSNPSSVTSYNNSMLIYICINLQTNKSNIQYVQQKCPNMSFIRQSKMTNHFSLITIYKYIQFKSF